MPEPAALPFAAGRAALAAELAKLSVSIGAGEDPQTIAIRRVHTLPVSSLNAGETPAFVMALPELPDFSERIGGAGGVRRDTIRQNVGLFVQNTETRQAAEILDAFIWETLRAFDQAVALGSTVDHLRGPRVLPANAELFGGIRYPHVTFEFEIRVTDAGRDIEA